MKPTFHCHLFITQLFFLDWDWLFGPFSYFYWSLWSLRLQWIIGTDLLPSERVNLIDILKINRIFYRTLCQIPSLSMRDSGLRWKFEQGAGELQKHVKRSSETKIGAECQCIVVESEILGSMGRIGRLSKRRSRDRDHCQDKQWPMSSKEIRFGMN